MYPDVLESDDDSGDGGADEREDDNGKAPTAEATGKGSHPSTKESSPKDTLRSEEVKPRALDELDPLLVHLPDRYWVPGLGMRGLGLAIGIHIFGFPVCGFRVTPASLNPEAHVPRWRGQVRSSLDGTALLTALRTAWLCARVGGGVLQGYRSCGYLCVDVWVLVWVGVFGHVYSCARAHVREPVRTCAGA